jgi:hypothetical protein
MFDPDTRDIVAVGSIDWDTGAWASNWWRISISP